MNMKVEENFVEFKGKKGHRGGQWGRMGTKNDI